MKTLLSWSSGKDSAWALHILRGQPDVSVVGLVTTLNEAFDRVAMHGVRSTLVELRRRPDFPCTGWTCLGHVRTKRTSAS
jgi:diphthamide synthase (EF-2-diphthine--ammonia ligase)